MFYDISALAIWEILALALGLIVGGLTYTSGAKGNWFSGWFRIALVVFAIGLIFAWFRWPLGRAGFWLEAALLMFAAYFIGCFVGGALHTLISPPKEEPKVAQRPASSTPDASASTPAPKAEDAAAPEGSVAASSVAGSASESIGASSATDAPVAALADAMAALASAAADLGPEPEKIAKVEGEDKYEGRRPVGYVAPRGGVPDDLQRIKGIGPQNEGRLHALGIWHFYQIAAWTSDNVHWVGGYLSFPGRIDREHWIEQATELAAGRAAGTINFGGGGSQLN